MWLPLLAALACTLTTPSATTATSAPAVVGATEPAAMSLPLDDGPASLLATWWSAPPAAGDLTRGAFSPAEIECAGAGAAAAAPDCGIGLSSRWWAERAASCDLPRPSHARIAALRRVRVLGGGSHLGAGVLRESEPPLAGDPSPPLCPPAYAMVWPALLATPLSSRAPATPPATPGRRIDRPPRAWPLSRIQ
jgi:hypothetical protein